MNSCLGLFALPEQKSRVKDRRFEDRAVLDAENMAWLSTLIALIIDIDKTSC
jgi:hypothetical protein